MLCFSPTRASNQWGEALDSDVIEDGVSEGLEQGRNTFELRVVLCLTQKEDQQQCEGEQVIMRIDQ